MIPIKIFDTMQKIRNTELLPGEKVIREENIHWKNYLVSFLLLTGCLCLNILKARFQGRPLIEMVQNSFTLPQEIKGIVNILEGVVLLVISLSCLCRIITIMSIRYYITNKRIIKKGGILNKNRSEMLLEKCEIIYLNQNIYEQFYNCGDILCVSAGASLFLDDVKNPVEFKRTIQELIIAKQDDE